MRIYADSNVYCRPFDDQSSLRVELETRACVALFKSIKEKHRTLLSSDVLLLELSAMNPSKYVRVLPYIRLCDEHAPLSDSIIERAGKLETEFGIPPYDALHLASADERRADVFITCDDDILKKVETLNKVVVCRIVNPLNFTH